MLHILVRHRPYQLVFFARDIGHIHVVSTGAEIFQFFASEDIDGNQVNLCVTVLARLRGAHFDNLAGPILDHNVPVLT